MLLLLWWLVGQGVLKRTGLEVRCSSFLVAAEYASSEPMKKMDDRVSALPTTPVTCRTIYKHNLHAAYTHNTFYTRWMEQLFIIRRKRAISAQ